MDRPPDKEKSLGTGPMIFLLGGMMIGAAVARVVVARWVPPGEGIDAGQLVASGLGGALGAVLGHTAWSLVARLLTGRRRG